jgi:hypothetical protein
MKNEKKHGKIAQKSYLNHLLVSNLCYVPNIIYVGLKLWPPKCILGVDAARRH